MPSRVSIAIAVLSVAGSLSAQVPDRTRLLEVWTRDSNNVMRYIEAMPDSAVEYHPTPGVRTFAAQFDHIVTTNFEVAAQTLAPGKPMPELGDSAAYLHNKAALRGYAAATFDYLLTLARRATPAQLAKSVSVWKQPNKPVWEWLELSHEHTVWTLGQTIPYLRLNGVTPPDYSIPF
ncbi:MAG TPA: DinB family protein [Gemmatimonadales bacterium]|nr:DinB family protein [Gemmatimonadales bacterium]